MKEFSVLSTEEAVQGSRDALGEAKKKYGFVPNLYGVLAHSPSAVKAYISLADLFSHTQFSPTEQQVVLLTASFENGCDYCMAAHSAVAKMVGVPADVLSALRSGTRLPDVKLERLREFTQKVVQSRGVVSEADLESFFSAGFGQQHVLDVILGVTMKTLSNYTNHIAETPLDPAFQAQRWQKTA